MQRVKRCGAGFMAIIMMLLCVVLTPAIEVSAVGNETDYSKRAGALMSYFHNDIESCEANKISENEFRAMAVMLSNFYVPFATRLNAVAEKVDKVSLLDGLELKNTSNAWEQFWGIWGREDEIDSDLIAELYKRFSMNFSSATVPIKLFLATKEGDGFTLITDADGKPKQAIVGNVFNTHVISGEDDNYAVKKGGQKVDINNIYLVWRDEDGELRSVAEESSTVSEDDSENAGTISEVSEDDDEQGRVTDASETTNRDAELSEDLHCAYYSLGSLEHKMVLNTLLCMFPTFGNSVTSVEDLGLYISPFGDIYMKSDGEDCYVLIPACLNEYAYGDDMELFPINNSYFIGATASYPRYKDREFDISDKQKVDTDSSFRHAGAYNSWKWYEDASILVSLKQDTTANPVEKPVIEFKELFNLFVPPAFVYSESEKVTIDGATFSIGKNYDGTKNINEYEMRDYTNGLYECFRDSFASNEAIVQWLMELSCCCNGNSRTNYEYPACKIQNGVYIPFIRNTNNKDALTAITNEELSAWGNNFKNAISTFFKTSDGNTLDDESLTKICNAMLNYCFDINTNGVAVFNDFIRRKYNKDSLAGDEFKTWVEQNIGYEEPVFSILRVLYFRYRNATCVDSSLYPTTEAVNVKEELKPIFDIVYWSALNKNATTEFLNVVVYNKDKAYADCIGENRTNNSSGVTNKSFAFQALREYSDAFHLPALALVSVNANIDRKIRGALKGNSLEEYKYNQVTGETYKDGVLNGLFTKSDIGLSGELDSYVSLFSSLYSTADGKAIAWFWGSSDKAMLSKLCYLQMPLSKTFSNIGLFNTGTTTIGATDTNWRERKFEAIKDISYFDRGMQNKAINFNAYPYNISEQLGFSLLGTLEKTSYVEGGSGVATTVNLWAGIYWAYEEKILGINTDLVQSSTPTFYHLPALVANDWAKTLTEMMSQANSEKQSNAELERKQKSIIDWTYQILNVVNDVSNDYRLSWLKNIIDGIFIGLHDKLVGVDLTGAITAVGNAKESGVYATAVGYISTPLFSELPIAGWVLEHYSTVYILLMMITTTVLVVMMLTKMRTLPKAILVFITMSVVLVLPVELLNVGISWSNVIADKIYSDKFTYWAVVQQAEYYNNLAKSADETGNVSDETQVLQYNLKQSQNLQGTGGVTLKWLAPKKNGIKTMLESQLKAKSGVSLFVYLAGDMLDGAEYVADADATYLNRTYNSIYTSADNGYYGLLNSPSDYRGLTENSNSFTGVTPTIQNMISTSEARDVLLSHGDIEDRFCTLDGYKIMQTIFGGVMKDGGTIPAGYYNGYLNNATLTNATRNRYKDFYRIYGLFADESLLKSVFLYNTNPASRNDAVGLDISSLVKTEEAGKVISNPYINTFVNYTESPYYYFYNVFNSVLVNSGGVDVSGNTDFVKVLLSPEFFEVTDENHPAYGSIKDYLDLEGLFTYIIPYLNYANQDVLAYQDKYGLEVRLSDFKTEQEYESAKKQLQNVWNLYSPWVDCLYGLMGTSQRLTSGYGRVVIQDPLNPVSYFINSRPMTFSPADAVIKGYSNMDLSTVETKLHKILTDTRADLEGLLNYKDFTAIGKNTRTASGKQQINGQEILISAGAMIATFHFNQEFSDHRFVGTGDQLYPQNFELRNMNYDSYLRLILGNATNSNIKLNSPTNIYVDIIHRTSFITALLMIAVDICGVLIIPVMKILFIVVLFGLALFMAFSCVTNPPNKMLRTVLTTFILPLFLFVCLVTAHALVVSWFMGQGVSGVIDTAGITISTGDPTITLALLLIVDVGTAYLMWLLFSKSAKTAARFVKSGVLGTLAVAGMGVSAVGNIAGKGLGLLGHGAIWTAGKAGKHIFRTGDVGEYDQLRKLNNKLTNNNIQGKASDGGIGERQIQKQKTPPVKLPVAVQGGTPATQMQNVPASPANRLTLVPNNEKTGAERNETRMMQGAGRQRSQQAPLTAESQKRLNTIYHAWSDGDKLITSKYGEDWQSIPQAVKERKALRGMLLRQVREPENIKQRKIQQAKIWSTERGEVEGEIPWAYPDTRPKIDHTDFLERNKKLYQAEVARVLEEQEKLARESNLTRRVETGIKLAQAKDKLNDMSQRMEQDEKYLGKGANEVLSLSAVINTLPNRAKR